MRRVPHFKLMVSVQNHRHTIGVYEDDALLAMFVRVGIMAVERFADRTGDSFLCSSLDLEKLAGCRGVANARRKLGRLEASSRLSVGREEARGGASVGPEGGQREASWRLTLPNFAKKQGFKSVVSTQTVPSASASASATSTASKEKKDKEPASETDALCVPKTKRPSKRPIPESIEGDDRSRLLRLGSDSGFSEDMCRYATTRVRLWAQGSGKLRTDWVAVIVNSMKAGWGLEGMPGRKDPGFKNYGQKLEDNSRKVREETDEFIEQHFRERGEESVRLDQQHVRLLVAGRGNS